MNDKEAIEILKKALQEIADLTTWNQIQEAKIDKIWNDFGGHTEFCKAFGYRRFANKILKELK